MRAAALSLVLLLAANASASILLGGEPLRVDKHGAIVLSQKQLRATDAATRGGLLRWASTAEGRRLLRYFSSAEYEVVVIEDRDEPGIGRAPEPGMLTLLASNDRKTVKRYELILNPSPVDVPQGMRPLPNQPATTVDWMSAAWAAEMLHIFLYSQGVRLPHHQRSDFQEAWIAIAAQLGFPAMSHGENEIRRSHRLTSED